MAGMYDQGPSPYAQQQTPATQPGSMVPNTMNDQQLHYAKLAMAQHHHTMRMNALAMASAKQAVQMHQVLGEQALRGALNAAMSGGQDPDYIRQVSQHLRQAGYNDTADLHDAAIEGWG